LNDNNNDGEEEEENFLNKLMANPKGCVKFVYYYLKNVLINQINGEGQGMDIELT